MSAYQSKKGGNHANDESLYANIIIFSIFAFVTPKIRKQSQWQSQLQ